MFAHLLVQHDLNHVKHFLALAEDQRAMAFGSMLCHKQKHPQSNLQSRQKGCEDKHWHTESRQLLTFSSSCASNETLPDSRINDSALISDEHLSQRANNRIETMVRNEGRVEVRA